VFRIHRVLVVGVAAAALVVAGCGSSKKSNTSTAAAPAAPASTTPASTTPASSGGSASGGGTLALSADPSGQLKFDKSSLSAKSGSVTIKMSNPSGLPHGIAVEGNGVDKDGQIVMQGGTSTVTVKLKPGTYTFYCPVDGHRAAGMQGKLTVT
jgi:plastocyanin